MEEAGTVWGVHVDVVVELRGRGVVNVSSDHPARVLSPSSCATARLCPYLALIMALGHTMHVLTYVRGSTFSTKRTT
jgi:hypothetical protein